MRSMPRVYRSFEEFARDEQTGVDSAQRSGAPCVEELDIDEMLDQMFADELDINFKQKTKAQPEAKPKAKDIAA